MNSSFRTGDGYLASLQASSALLDEHGILRVAGTIVYPPPMLGKDPRQRDELLGAVSSGQITTAIHSLRSAYARHGLDLTNYCLHRDGQGLAADATFLFHESAPVTSNDLEERFPFFAALSAAQKVRIGRLFALPTDVRSLTYDQLSPHMASMPRGTTFSESGLESGKLSVPLDGIEWHHGGDFLSSRDYRDLLHDGKGYAQAHQRRLKESSPLLRGDQRLNLRSIGGNNTGELAFHDTRHHVFLVDEQTNIPGLRHGASQLIEMAKGGDARHVELYSDAPVLAEDVRINISAYPLQRPTPVSVAPGLSALPAHPGQIEAGNGNVTEFVNAVLQPGRELAFIIGEDGSMIRVQPGAREGLHDRLCFAVEQLHTGRANSIDDLCREYGLPTGGAHNLRKALEGCAQHNHHATYLGESLPPVEDFNRLTQRGIGSMVFGNFTAPRSINGKDWSQFGMDAEQFMAMCRLWKEGKMQFYWRDPLEQLRVFHGRNFVKMPRLERHLRTTFRYMFMCSHKPGLEEKVKPHLVRLLSELSQDAAEMGVEIGFVHGGEDAGLMHTISQTALELDMMSYGISTVFHDARNLRPDFNSDGIAVFQGRDLDVRQSELEHSADAAAVLNGGVGSDQERATRSVKSHVGLALPAPFGMLDPVRMGGQHNWLHTSEQLAYQSTAYDVDGTRVRLCGEFMPHLLSMDLESQDPYADFDKWRNDMREFLSDPDVWRMQKGVPDQTFKKGLEGRVHQAHMRGLRIAEPLRRACKKHGLDAVGA